MSSYPPAMEEWPSQESSMRGSGATERTINTLKASYELMTYLSKKYGSPCALPDDDDTEGQRLSKAVAMASGELEQ